MKGFIGNTPLAHLLHDQRIPFDEIACFCNVPLDTLRSWLRGDTEPTAPVKKSLAQYLGVPPQKLWPWIAPLIDPEEEYDFITGQFCNVHYRDNYRQFLDLCSRRAALSVKIYICERRRSRRQETTWIDSYTLPSALVENRE